MTAWAGYSWSGQWQVSRLNMAQALALVLVCTGSRRSMQLNTCWPALHRTFTLPCTKARQSQWTGRHAPPCLEPSATLALLSCPAQTPALMLQLTAQTPASTKDTGRTTGTNRPCLAQNLNVPPSSCPTLLRIPPAPVGEMAL